MSTLFNEKQLATYEEARALRELLNHYGVGGGIAPGDDSAGVQMVSNPNFPWLPPLPLSKPGIFIPPWEGGPTGFAVPSSGEAKFLHFRFANGAEGMNIGLCREKFKSFPLAAAYVFNTLNQEAQDLARTQGK